MALTDGVHRLDSTTVSYFTNTVSPKIIEIKKKKYKETKSNVEGVSHCYIILIKSFNNITKLDISVFWWSDKLYSICKIK